MALTDHDKVSSIIIECAERYAIPRYKALKDHEISTKSGPNDLVTQADLDIEEHLIRALPELLPGSIVVGEEAVSKGEASLDVLNSGDSKVWVVDPIDGTKNFVNGSPDFGIMVALVIDGKTQAGWIYDVLKDHMYSAEIGEGAFVNGNKRLKVNETKGLKDAVAHMNYKYFPKELQPDIKDIATFFKSGTSLNSAAHEYTRIASGASDISLYSRLRPWDHLPGSLIVEEAGGYIAKWDKNPYTPQDQYAGLIVTSSEESWNNVYDLVFGRVDISKYI